MCSSRRDVERGLRWFRSGKGKLFTFGVKLKIFKVLRLGRLDNSTGKQLIFLHTYIRSTSRETKDLISGRFSIIEQPYNSKVWRDVRYSRFWRDVALSQFHIFNPFRPLKFFMDGSCSRRGHL
uniref:Uncharacterized protein n=1 Tax=Opuntia streptacantha TaxID=393608 RepID=A0A7C9ARE1_OPUST